jgi:hypothetical protein
MESRTRCAARLSSLLASLEVDALLDLIISIPIQVGDFLNLQQP